MFFPPLNLPDGKSAAWAILAALATLGVIAAVVGAVVVIQR